ncbi:MAG: hypothetical protein [Saothovirus cruti]|uniref:Uncharacterized protein n=1 Tax=Cressdnaviricota sp. TaxID=2748378 RepID=A0A3G2YTA8_9VIRU|nr:MAG: hypothetical protein [Cressdnaviricota sp.]
MECLSPSCQSPTAAKGPIGLGHCQMPLGFRHSLKECAMCEASLNKVKVGSNTIRYSSSPIGRCLWPRSEECGPLSLDTGSLPDPKPPRTTFGKISHALESPLNLVKGPSREIQALTGNKSRGSLNQVSWKRSPETYTSVIILTSAVSGQTLYNQLLWTECVQYFGAQLVQESRIEPGDSPVMMHSVKIHVQSSGAATSVKLMLLSMNFEEVLTFRTCCAGSTNIRSEWKSKDPVSPSWPRRSLSPRICTPPPGTPNSTGRPISLLNDD